MKNEINKIEDILKKELGEFYHYVKTSYYNNKQLRFITFNMLDSHYEIVPSNILDLISKYNWCIEHLSFSENGFYMIIENRNFTIPVEEYNSINALI